MGYIDEIKLYNNPINDIHDKRIAAIDSTVVSDSSNPVSGGAVKTYVDTNYIPIEGNAATATNAKTELKTDQKFLFRKTNVDWDAKSGVVKKIKGKTNAWNQMVKNGDFSNGTTGWIGYDASQSVSEKVNSFIASSRYGGIRQDGINVPAGHKIFCSCEIKTTTPTDQIQFLTQFSGGTAAHVMSAAASGWQRLVFFASLGSDVFNIFIRDNRPSDWDAVQVRNVFYIDLTRLYGSEIDGMTDADILAKFKSEYPGYHAYNAGKLISNDAKQLETVGVNQWDEEWENGYYTGSVGEALVKSTNSDFIRCANLIKVMPSTAYNLHFGHIGGGWLFKEVDENGIVVKSTAVSSYDLIITTDSRTSYIVWYISQMATYNHDICINLSNPAINGQYFPYWKRTLQLSITTKEDTDGNVPFADGMKGAGTAADWADKVGGEKRIGRVDLGSLEWEYIYLGTANEMIRSKQVVSGIKKGVSSVVSNIICVPYTAKTENQLYGHSAVGIAVAGDGKLVVYDTDYASDVSTIDAFTAATDGVMLDFELATPVPFAWAEPLPSVYPCDQYGTERIISPESTTPSAPFVADFQYGATSSDIAFELNTIEDNYMSSGSMRNILDALVTAGLFASYTLTYNDATGKWDCAITPNS